MQWAKKLKFTNIAMEALTRGNGVVIKDMGMESSSGFQVLSMLVLSETTANMVKVV